MRWRMDGPRRDDHLATAELRLLTVDQCLDADAARSLEQQRPDLRQGGDRQIVAQPRPGYEIADRRRDPAVVEVGDRDREIAVPEFAVLILDVRTTGLLERLGARIGMSVPQIGKDAADRDAAVLAVPGPVEIHVA